MYKTDISVLKWIIYDIFGNVGWLAYFVAYGKCIAERPDFIGSGVLKAVFILAAIPVLLMLIGLIELISERICKLDYVLPKKRLLRGFGALTLGGITGALIPLIGIIYAALSGAGADITGLYIMLFGGALCAIFAGLLFKGYRKID